MAMPKKQEGSSNKVSRRTPLKVKKNEDGGFALPSLEEGVESSLQAFVETFGSADRDLLRRLSNEVVNVIPPGARQDPQEWVNSVLAALHGISPRDPLEAMLAIQMVAVHTVGMECGRRTLLEGQSFDGTEANINRMTKMMRTFTSQVEALQKYRNGGKQTVTVQHVNVTDGGQAVIGNVSKGEGANG